MFVAHYQTSVASFIPPGLVQMVKEIAGTQARCPWPGAQRAFCISSVYELSPPNIPSTFVL